MRAAPSSSSGGATYRAAARTSAGAVGMAVPWPTSAIISKSFHWSPIASVAASGIRSRRARNRMARPLDTPGATNSRKRGCEIVDLGDAGELRPGVGGDLDRQRRLPDREDLGDRVVDRLHRSGTSSARAPMNAE